MKNKNRTAVIFLVIVAATAALVFPMRGTTEMRKSATLKDAYKGAFLIGAAINQRQYNEEDKVAVSILETQFNSISPENVLKWESVHPQPDKYDFAGPDAYVAFGEKHHMFIIGHTLVWHSQTPRWVFQDDKGNPADRDTLLNRMHDHIRTVVGRYKGRIRGWDVVNEALNEDGSMRQSPWMKIIGPDFVIKAFQFAHEADPGAELYYNDYSIENEAKRKGAIRLINELKAAGVPVRAIGIQEHNKMDWPTLDQLDKSIQEFGDLGIKVNITELDVDVLPAATMNRGADVSMNVELKAKLNPYTAGLPDNVQRALADRYADLFGVYLKHKDVVTRVTLWGVTDAQSWLNNWPVRGRTSYPLLFDREGKPKAAFDAIVRLPAKNSPAE